MERKPKSFPDSNLQNVLNTLVKCAGNKQEEFLVKLVQTLDKNDTGTATYLEAVAGVKK